MATLREMIRSKVEQNKINKPVEKQKNTQPAQTTPITPMPPAPTPAPLPSIVTTAPPVTTPLPLPPPPTTPPPTTTLPPTPIPPPTTTPVVVIKTKIEKTPESPKSKISSTVAKAVSKPSVEVKEIKAPDISESVFSAKKVEKEKILNFCKGISKYLNNDLSDIIKLFKARPKDPLLLMYDKDFKYFATSTDGNTWTKNVRADVEFMGYITLPERGTIWQARNARSLFLVLDFCNLRTTKPQEEPPMVIYMDELGNNKSIPIVLWHSKMMFCDHTVGKDK